MRRGGVQGVILNAGAISTVMDIERGFSCVFSEN